MLNYCHSSVVTKYRGYLLQTLNEKEVYDWLYAINPLLAGRIRFVIKQVMLKFIHLTLFSDPTWHDKTSTSPHHRQRPSHARQARPLKNSSTDRRSSIWTNEIRWRWSLCCYIKLLTLPSSSHPQNFKNGPITEPALLHSLHLSLSPSSGTSTIMITKKKSMTQIPSRRLN